MRHNYRIEYKHVLLRPLEEKDIEELRVLRNKNREFFLDSSYITPEQQVVWFQQYLERENDIMFAAELIDRPGEFIGAIALYNIDESMTAESGRTLIDKEKAPMKGLGVEITVASHNLAFSQLGIKKIVCNAFKSNERVIKVDLRAGYVIVREDEESYYFEKFPDSPYEA